MTQFFICLLLLQIKRDPALGGSAKILREYQQSTEFQDLILAAYNEAKLKNHKNFQEGPPRLYRNSFVDVDFCEDSDRSLLFVRERLKMMQNIANLTCEGFNKHLTEYNRLFTSKDHGPSAAVRLSFITFI